MILQPFYTTEARLFTKTRGGLRKKSISHGMGDPELTEEEIRKDERQRMASWIRSTSSVWEEGIRSLLDDLADQIEESDHNRFLEILSQTVPTRENHRVRFPILRERRPCIRGTTFLISILLAELADGNQTLEDVCSDHDLEVEAAHDALQWVAINMDTKLK